MKKGLYRGYIENGSIVYVDPQTGNEISRNVISRPTIIKVEEEVTTATVAKPRVVGWEEPEDLFIWGFLFENRRKRK